jgi:hypothetical protein
LSLNREIALCGLAIFLCEELKHQRTESPIRPFIVFIVECLQVGFISIKETYFRIMRRYKIFFLIFLLKGQANQRISVERKEHVSMLAAVGRVNSEK